MPKSRKPPTKAPRDPYRMRPCRLCKAQFRPTTHVVACADSQEFCCPNHRKEYWKYGGLPFDKLMVRIEKRCREIAREEIASALLLRLRSEEAQHSLDSFSPRRNAPDKDGTYWDDADRPPTST